MGSQDGAEGAHAAEQQAPQPDPVPAEAGPAAPDAATREDGAPVGEGCGPCCLPGSLQPGTGRVNERGVQQRVCAHVPLSGQRGAGRRQSL